MTKYEYLNFSVNTIKKEWIIKFDGKQYSYTKDFNTIMERLGFEGWELISVVPMVGSEKSFGMEVSFTYTTKIIYYFKKELTEDMIAIKEAAEADRKEKKQKIETAKKESIYEIDKLIEAYTLDGYQVKFQHKNRIIFGKGIEEVRFDYNDESGQWIEKK